MKLKKDDRVISMSILVSQVGTVDERAAYLRSAPWKSDAPKPELSKKRTAELVAAEEFILTVTEKGFGKRSSAYEYRITGRGGKGIANIEMTDRNGPVVAAFPVSPTDQIMLVTDAGKLIRCPVDDIRIAGRKTQGVTLFRVDPDERVVSVAWLSESNGDDENGGDTEGGDA